MTEREFLEKYHAAGTGDRLLDALFVMPLENRLDIVTDLRCVVTQQLRTRIEQLTNALPIEDRP
jgi:hypothetical protein